MHFFRHGIELDECFRADRPVFDSRLLDLGAPTLDKEQQHDHKEHGSDDTDDFNIAHDSRFPSFLVKIRTESLHHNDEAWCKHNNEQ